MRLQSQKCLVHIGLGDHSQDFKNNREAAFEAFFKAKEMHVKICSIQSSVGAEHGLHRLEESQHSSSQSNQKKGSASHLGDDASLDQEGSDGDREKGLEWRDRSKNHQNCKFRD